jgi:hypothetical protein
MFRGFARQKEGYMRPREPTYMLVLALVGEVEALVEVAISAVVVINHARTANPGE